MRIQILPLPPITLGEATSTPFVVVLDRLTEHEKESVTPPVSHWIRESWGAASVFISGESDVEISPELELAPEIQEALTATLAAAATGASN